jgi:cellulose synthase/poly-beta-1,6-N-acetylglucosamine synthase-like glycosyltransferase
MKWIFAVSLLLIAYTYAGYPLWLWVRARWRPQPVHTAAIFPSVSIVLAVHNEAEALPAKLRNLADLDYPPDRLEVVIVSDGSTDGTNQILAAQAEKRLSVVFSREHLGKGSALNRGVQAASGAIVVFTDARQRLAADALRHLVRNFADPSVGCVSGELMLGEPGATACAQGVGLYWSIEKKIRQWESVTGSVVGATGALYAVRRELIVPLPPGTILDDVYIPLHVARHGARVAFEPAARAWDVVTPSPQQEFRRKVRTLTGNYQLVQLAPWLLSRANPVRFKFVSHKLCRLLAPFALAGVLCSSVLLEGPLYRLALVLQLLFYGLGLLAMARRKLGGATRLAHVALAFLMLNTAAVVAFVNFVTRKKEVWVR